MMGKMEFEISLNNLRFFAYHGVFEAERLTGNEFLVNLSIFFPVIEKIEDDLLADTISYAELFEIVKTEMEEPRNLLEKVCIEIASKIRVRFPSVSHGFVSIEKVRPPIPSMLGSASVRLNF